MHLILCAMLCDDDRMVDMYECKSSVVEIALGIKFRWNIFERY